MNDLIEKGCPFCGSSSELAKGLLDIYGRIWCKSCGAVGPETRSGLGWDDRRLAEGHPSKLALEDARDAIADALAALEAAL